MTNEKFFEKELEELYTEDETCLSSKIAIVDGRPRKCKHTPCEECIRHRKGICSEIALLKWLKAENIVLNENEIALCRILDEGYFARDAKGDLWWYSEKPEKKEDSSVWTNCGRYLSHIHSKIYKNIKFSFIQFTDDEPWAVKDLLELGGAK